MKKEKPTKCEECGKKTKDLTEWKSYKKKTTNHFCNDCALRIAFQNFMPKVWRDDQNI